MRRALAIGSSAVLAALALLLWRTCTVAPAMPVRAAPVDGGVLLVDASVAPDPRREGLARLTRELADRLCEPASVALCEARDRCSCDSAPDCLTEARVDCDHFVGWVSSLSARMVGWEDVSEFAIDGDATDACLAGMRASVAACMDIRRVDACFVMVMPAGTLRRPLVREPMPHPVVRRSSERPCGLGQSGRAYREGMDGEPNYGCPFREICVGELGAICLGESHEDDVGTACALGCVDGEVLPGAGDACEPPSSSFEMDVSEELDRDGEGEE